MVCVRDTRETEISPSETDVRVRRCFGLCVCWVSRRDGERPLVFDDLRWRWGSAWVARVRLRLAWLDAPYSVPSLTRVSTFARAAAGSASGLDTGGGCSDLSDVQGYHHGLCRWGRLPTPQGTPRQCCSPPVYDLIISSRRDEAAASGDVMHVH